LIYGKKLLKKFAEIDTIRPIPTTMNEKKDYLNRIFNLARLRGLCQTKQDFAALIAASPSTISRAMAGEENYLTDNLLNRVRVWASQVGLEDLPQQEERGQDIVIPAATAVFYENLSETLKNMSVTVRMQQELISQLQSGAHIPELGKKKIG